MGLAEARAQLPSAARRRRPCGACSSPISTTTAPPTSSCPGRPRRVSCSAAAARTRSRRSRDAPIAADVQAAADLDGDGRLELVGARRRPARRARRAAGSDGLPLAGAPAARRDGDRRSAHQLVRHRRRGRGAHRTAPAEAGHRRRRSSTSASARPTRAEVVRIIWPNGVLQSEFDATADTTVAATQRLKGSCPWLFAWNGREMAFVTDLIWRSPLGLRINAQATADVLMTEDWVKVRGDQLAPRDGAYDLRITAELWETHFFDLALAAGRRSSGGHRGLRRRALRGAAADAARRSSTGPVQPFAAVRDDRGARRLGRRRARATIGISISPAAARTRASRATHFVEMELPDDAPRSGPLWLVAQGWVHPTDSSINVAIGQGAHAAPAGPVARTSRTPAGRFRDGARRPRLSRRARTRRSCIDLDGRLPARPGRGACGSRRTSRSSGIGSAGRSGRPDVQVDAAPARRCSRRTCAIAATRSTEQTDAELARAAALRARRHGAALARSRGLPHALRRRARAAARRRRSLRDHERRRRAARCASPRRRRRRPGSVRDFVAGRRRLGEGRRLQHDASRAPCCRCRRTRPAATTRRRGGSRTIPVYRAHRDDFAEYHTRYVTPDRVRDALRAAGRAPPIDR